MADLDTEPRFDNPDAAFQLVVDAHRALDAEASAEFNARLVLLLANHIGDLNVLKQAVEAAAKTAR
jgi:hypothetical protein